MRARWFWKEHETDGKHHGIKLKNHLSELSWRDCGVKWFSPQEIVCKHQHKPDHTQ